MKTITLTVVSLLVGVAMAADITINEDTVYNEGVTVDNVYANANIQVGDTAATILRINAGKYIYLPGSNGANAIFKIRKGRIIINNNSVTGGFRIGTYSGLDHLNIENFGEQITNLGYVEVGDNAVANVSGYVDLSIGAGKRDDGHWRRIYITQIANYRTKTSDPFRILFANGGGALALMYSSDHTAFYVKNENAKTVLEGDGEDIVFFEGNTGAGSPSDMIVLSASSKGVLRTQGDCDLVFHNIYGTSSEVNPCPSYSFNLCHSTNRFEWAHTGETVISNSCVLQVTADYALPNGSQTGPLHFKASDSKGNPWLDLCGTTQIVNGVRNSIDSRTYSNVIDIRSVITNSSEKTAFLIVRNEGVEDFCVGHVKSNISLRKEGAGKLLVSRARFSRNNFDVSAGIVVLTNAFDGVAYEFRAVTVSDGARLVVDGCKLDCTSLATSGSGGVEFRNGATVSGVDVSSARFVLDSSANSQGSFLFSGLSGTVGSVSVEKTGAEALTIPYYGQPYGDVHVREGLLRPAGQFVDKPYWRYTFTETTTRGSVKVHLKNGSGYDEAQTTILPAFALNRIHQFGSSGDRCSSGFAWAGKNAATLAAGQCTANMTHYESSGFGANGGFFSEPNVFSYNKDDASWVNGIGFESESNLSDGNPLAITFRVRNGDPAALGYLFLRCVNYSYARPYSWTVEASDDGTAWTTVDARSQLDLLSSTGPKTYPNDGVPLLFGAGKSSWQFRPTGTVSVDGGATLDTSDLIDGNISIRSITVDMEAGAGTITKFVPAANGELRIDNLSGDFPKCVDLLELGTVVGEDNLKGWAVYVNGVKENNIRVQIRNGVLQARKVSGLVLIFK